MKKTLQLLLFLCLFFSTSLLYSQSSVSPVSIIQKYKNFPMAEANQMALDFFKNQADAFQMSPASKMELKQQEVSPYGIQHQKFQQYHHNLPVFGATYILHSKDNVVLHANGHFRPLLDVSPTPKINQDQAFQIALQSMDAKQYNWEETIPDLFRKEKPIPKLMYFDPEFPDLSPYVKLAYAIEITSYLPHDKQLIFVDAQNGAVLQTFDRLHEHAVPATAKTKYYGTQTITVDSLSPEEFHLHDPTRGDGIHTYDNDFNVYKNNSSNWDLTNEAQDEVALDAHFCTERFHDLLKNEFDWFGIDNAGGEMSTVVHAGQFVNAYWDGTYAYFGDGNCLNGPLTTLEVVGHEFTHGVIDYTSELIYSGESGAINESMADIMGKALEFKEDPTRFNWELGRSFQEDLSQDPFRSFSDPNSLGMPAFYKGLNWSDGAGVHTNSSVGNHWFYLLSEGISGTNELGENYAIDSLGVQKAAEIAFHCNRHYLTSNSTYPDFYALSLQTAEELYGAGAPEITAVAEAWKAVGLPGSGPTIAKDIAVTIPDRFLYTCGTNFFVPIEFSLTNLGSEDFIPDSDDVVTLIYNKDGSNVELDVPITEIIPIGEAWPILVDDFLFAEANLNTFVTIQLPGSTDDNFQNNTKSIWVRNYAESDNELRLLGNVYEYNCLTKTHNTSFVLNNNSCNPFPPNTPVLLEITDDNGNSYWSENYIIPDGIASSRSHQVNFNVSLDWAPVPYRLQATLAGDPVSDNNFVEVEIWNAVEFGIDFSQPFDELSTFEDSMQVDSRTNPFITEYNNDFYFSTANIVGGDFFTFCAEAEDNLIGDYEDFNPISGRIIACADFTDALSPVMEFDLVQFRNANLSMPSDVSCITEVTYESPQGNGKELIYGQEEGIIEHHSVQLPDDFHGAIKFRFSSQSGTNASQADYLEYDVNLLNNLTFSSLPVSTTTPLEERIKIAPNPATQQIYLVGVDITHPDNILMYNAQGQGIPIDGIFRDNNLNISNLSNGFYYLSVLLSDKERVVLPFVKINP